MEHKTWLWRRKNSEKIAHGNDKHGLPLKEDQEKVVTAEGLERSLKHLSEKLAFAVTESNAKDDLLLKHIKVAEEALEGWEKAEAEAALFKQQLEDALQCKISAEKKLTSIEAALEECKCQFQMTLEEQKQIVNDNALKTLQEKEKTRKLEEKLGEVNKWLSKLGTENCTLIKTLQTKEKAIEDLVGHNNQADAKITFLTENHDSLEKNNASLKFEICMLEKELQVRNEERDFNLKSADALHKQHLESIKKIAKLESECQRLRVMVRKRLPGPAAVAKMRTEVEMLGKDTFEMKNKKSDHSTVWMIRDLKPANYADLSNKGISFVERLNAMEEENKILKESLTKKNNELQSARVMCARTASKLSQAETKIEEMSKGNTDLELARHNSLSYDKPVASNEDNISCAESWASALISELENFRNGKAATSSMSSVVSELNLMDDFVEMEKLAIVCVDKPLVSSCSLSDATNSCLSSCETTSKKSIPEALQRDVLAHSLSGVNNSNVEIESCTSIDMPPKWLQDVVNVILYRHRVSQRSLDSILEDVRLTLAAKGYSVRSHHPPDSLHDGNSLKRQHSSPRLSNVDCREKLSLTEVAPALYKSKLDKSINRLIKLIEGISESSADDSMLQVVYKIDGSTIQGRRSSCAHHISLLFHWRTGLASILQDFAHRCSNLLQGKAGLEVFFEELISAMEQIINNCFSIQDISSVKDAIQKLQCCEDCECQNLEQIFSVGSKNFKKLSLPTHVPKNSEEVSKLDDENKSLKNERTNIQPLNNGSGVGRKAATSNNEPGISQLEVLEQTILSLREELEAERELKRITKENIENQRLQNQDLGSLLSSATAELSEDKHKCHEELEVTCLELQQPMHSALDKETSNGATNEDQKHLRASLEISAASQKLQECQETVFNLGRQLKALASPRNAALFDKVISTPDGPKIRHHTSLVNRMLAEDNEESEPMNQNMEQSEHRGAQQLACGLPNPNAGMLYGHKILPNHESSSFVANGNRTSTSSLGRLYSFDELKDKTESGVVSFAIVPKRQRTRVSLLKKLLSRRKMDKSKIRSPHGVP